MTEVPDVGSVHLEDSVLDTDHELRVPSGSGETFGPRWRARVDSSTRPAAVEAGQIR